jgi:hypothetical protein
MLASKVSIISQTIKEFSIDELLEFNQLIGEVIKMKNCQEYVKSSIANERQPVDDIDRQLPI